MFVLSSYWHSAKMIAGGIELGMLAVASYTAILRSSWAMFDWSAGAGQTFISSGVHSFVVEQETCLHLCSMSLFQLMDRVCCLHTVCSKNCKLVMVCFNSLWSWPNVNWIMKGRTFSVHCQLPWLHVFTVNYPKFGAQYVVFGRWLYSLSRAWAQFFKLSDSYNYNLHLALAPKTLGHGLPQLSVDLNQGFKFGWSARPAVSSILNHARLCQEL